MLKFITLSQIPPTLSLIIHTMSASVVVILVVLAAVLGKSHVPSAILHSTILPLLVLFCLCLIWKLHRALQELKSTEETLKKLEHSCSRVS